VTLSSRKLNGEKPHKLVLFATYPVRINPLLAGMGCRTS
jgi:hypothetical protein